MSATPAATFAVAGPSVMSPRVGMGVRVDARRMGSNPVPGPPVRVGDVALHLLHLDTSGALRRLLLGDLPDGRPVDAIRSFLGVPLGLVASLEFPFRGL
ncbi:MAG: hypothetical protein L3J96_00410 [Thermoplasmata archaeon]|nr:hypothetical protein [Thermoplasmata archaeon]